MKTDTVRLSETEEEAVRISDFMPDDVDLSLFDGEFTIGGDVSLRCTSVSRVGDLSKVGFSMESDGGRADYMMLGGRHYFAEWGSYRFGDGLAVAAQMDHPLIELHFQLEGATPRMQSSFGFDLDLHAGQSNFAFIPSVAESFHMKGDAEGASFSIALSDRFFTQLSERHPELLEEYLAKMERDEPFILRPDHFDITPRMRGVLERIRRHEGVRGAGSLFLEAQIVELLSLQFGQLQQPETTNGRHLSRADADRIREAAALLVERMDDPPSLGELARHALMNDFKLKRGFKEIFGTSPYAYLLEHKLEVARTYLLDSDLSIAEISRRVGYRDPAHLTNAFRKRYGIRPSDLRNGNGAATKNGARSG